jgi:hypothetical protein
VSREMLEKVITTSSIGANQSGILLPEQAHQFLDYAWDATVIGQECERRRMHSPVQEWDTLTVGARVARKATEAVDTGENATPNFTKVSITTTKIRMDWELSAESLEDNIEGATLDDHLARLFAMQFGQDMEDLAINGDVTSADPTLKSFDGWHKKALAGGRVVQALNGTAGLGRVHFNQALKNLPRKFIARKGDLRFYSSTQLLQDYLFSQSDINVVPRGIVESELRTMSVPDGPAGYVTNFPFGVELKEVPLMDTNFNEVNANTGTTAADSTSYIELTHPKNRIWGVQREIQMYREYVAKKDTIEYTMFFRTGIAWQNLDAVVTVNNISVKA